MPGGAVAGGLRDCPENRWSAARPSGTDAVYQVYAERFHGLSLINIAERTRPRRTWYDVFCRN